jgi:hypothetical protein
MKQVIKIPCETRVALKAFYEPSLRALAAMLRDDHDHHVAPELETWDGCFDDSEMPDCE